MLLTRYVSEDNYKKKGIKGDLWEKCQENKKYKQGKETSVHFLLT